MGSGVLSGGPPVASGVTWRMAVCRPLGPEKTGPADRSATLPVLSHHQGRAPGAHGLCPAV